MKRSSIPLPALALLTAIIALAGCSENANITQVKALPFSYPSDNVPDPNMTVDQVLDHRKICHSVKWKVDKTDRDQTFIEYECNYKGVADSGFIAHDNSGVASAGDVYQWLYGANGQPALSYVSFIIRYKNGTSKDFKFDATKVMELASQNEAMNFDQAFSNFTGAPVLVKPASPITDATYGNTLASLFPGHSAKEAAILGYRWIQSPLKIYGVEKLGYPFLNASCNFTGGFGCAVELNDGYGDGIAENDIKLGHQLFPVDPKDVQIAIHPDSGLDFQTTFKQLSSNKIACLSHLCFDNDGKVVGSTPASMVTQEVETNDPSRGFIGGRAPVQQASQASAPSPSSLPADDPKAIAEMTALALKAAQASSDDPNNINGQLDPLETGDAPLWAGKPRSDGYPNYAVTCDLHKQMCTSLNAVGNPLEMPISDAADGLTVMRNADVVSGKFTCRHGICVDAQMNLVGRLSASMAQLDPAAMQ